MKRRDKYLGKFTLQLLLILLPSSMAAQPAFNTSRSNFSGLTGVSWNPATVADNPFRVQIQLFAVDAHATNNGFRYMGAWPPPESTFNLSEFQSFGSREQPKLFSAGMSVRGPGLIVRLGAKHSAAFSKRVRTVLQGYSISHDVLQDALDSYQYRKSVTNNSMNLNMNAFAEWDLSYGRVLHNKGRHLIKAGITAKLLEGVTSAFADGKNIAYEVGSRRYPESDTTLRIQRFDGAFGYANPQAFEDLDVGTIMHWLVRPDVHGRGVGADVGVVYELRPNSATGDDGETDKSKNKYRVRISAALVDLGAIKYRDAIAYKGLSLRDVGVHNKELNGINLSNYALRTEAILRPDAINRQTHFTTGLPTAFNGDLDYRVIRNFYVNVAVSHGLRGNKNAAMRSFSYAIFSPRFESKWVDVALSISQINNYQIPAYGIMVRIGPVTIGSNDILALAGTTEPYGAHAYAEISLLMLAKKKRKIDR